MSRHRRQVIVAGSMPSSFPCTRWASIADASRLLAAAIACRSPVKCRLMSSPGTTWATAGAGASALCAERRPDGRLSEADERALADVAEPSVREIAVVVLPSPAFVGVTAVTAISFPLGCVASRSRTERSIFALSRPKSSTSAGSRSRLAASSEIGRSSDWGSGSASSFRSHGSAYAHCGQSAPSVSTLSGARITRNPLRGALRCRQRRSAGPSERKEET